MKVREYLDRNPRRILTVQTQTPIRDAMAMLLDNRISCLPVLGEADNLAGIISDKDIFRAAYKSPSGFIDLVVGNLMTTNLIVGVADDDLDYIAGIMTNNRIRHVPIVEKKQLVGLLSVGDIVKSQLKNIQIENRYLLRYIHDQYPG
jgi:CBS domain-containing protein